MTIFSRILKWNNDRMLIKTPKDLNLKNESSFILEELLEMNTDLKSDKANEEARKMVSQIVSDDYKSESEQIVDAAGDIIVFATWIIAKAGYNPDIVMEEVLKEIESRKWTIIEWKFVKDKSDEAKKNWYKADFSKAKN